MLNNILGSNKRDRSRLWTLAALLVGALAVPVVATYLFVAAMKQGYFTPQSLTHVRAVVVLTADQCRALPSELTPSMDGSVCTMTGYGALPTGTATWVTLYATPAHGDPHAQIPAAGTVFLSVR